MVRVGNVQVATLVGDESEERALSEIAQLRAYLTVLWVAMMSIPLTLKALVSGAGERDGKTYLEARNHATASKVLGIGGATLG